MQHSRALQSDAPRDIPNYDILSLIARGGFGSVWLARERVTGVTRAVKVLVKGDAARTERDIQGVRDYQRSSHNHPHLIQILTVGETDECFDYVMEAADNGSTDPAVAYEAMTLRARLDRDGRLSGKTALEWASAIASGIAQLHRQGLAHLDLKPDNVLMVDGQPKLADVGLVGKIGEPRGRSGTPAYMTPEGAADDLFALGRVLYEMISGLPATEYPRLPAEIMSDVDTHLSSAVQIANALCHRDPGRRPSDVSHVLDALQSALRGGRGWRGAWRALPGPVRIAAVVAGVLALGFAGRSVVSRGTPGSTVTNRHAASLALKDWALLPRDADSTSLGRERPRPKPSVRLRGEPVMADATLIQPLPRPISDFVVDVRFLARRSWGGLTIGLASRPDGGDGVRMSFTGQPDGEGLYCAADALAVPDDRNEPVIRGHPQPGVEYVARLTDRGESLRLELWPLTRCSPVPLVQNVPWGRTDFSARYVLIEHFAGHFPDHVDVQSIVVHELTGVARDGSLPAPISADDLPVRAFVEPLRNVCPRPEEDALSDRWNPHQSDVWTPIGNWSWWYRESRATWLWNVVRALPFSTELRRVAGPDAMGGYQFLRFDGCEFDDVRMTCQVELPGLVSRFTGKGTDSAGQGSVSHERYFGFAARLQDRPDAGAAWGGGYTACLNAHSISDPVMCSINRFDGLVLGDEVAFEVGPGRSGLVLADEIVPPSLLTGHAGRSDVVELAFEARGSRLSLSVNGVEVCAAVDSRYRAGRVGLCTFRAMATFGDLHLLRLTDSRTVPAPPVASEVSASDKATDAVARP